jgi:YYY domain-containing protein
VALVAAVLLGNLDLPRALAANVDALRAIVAADTPAAPGAWREALTRQSDRWFWAPSRTVAERPGSSFEINEFPSFSFLLGDLHPSMMALPLQVLALTALLALAAPALWNPTTGGRSTRRLLLAIAAMGFCVAILRATNAWDWPLYLTLAGAGAALSAAQGNMRGTQRCAGKAPWATRWAGGALLIAALVGAQALWALPFSSYFVTGPVTLRWFEGTQTPLSAWLAIQGWFLVVILGWAYGLARAAPLPSEDRAFCTYALRVLSLIRWAGVLYTVAMLVLAVVHPGRAVSAVGLQFAVVAGLCELLWRYRHAPTEAAGLTAAVAGFALALAVEFVVVGQDHGRMNTYFKFHVQSWVLLSVASGIALGRLAGGNGTVRRRPIYAATLGAATVLALAYLPLAIHGRAQTRFDPAAVATLDGEAFLAYAIHDYGGVRLRLADDYRLIRWLREHSAADDVVVEAQLPEYRWGSRMSAFTGRPTLLGYRYHETQQRPVPPLGEAIELRRQNVAAIYESPDAGRAIDILRHYHARFLVVGALERAAYPAVGLAKFGALVASGDLQVAYASGADVIYGVPDQPVRASSKQASW